MRCDGELPPVADGSETSKTTAPDVAAKETDVAAETAPTSGKLWMKASEIPASGLGPCLSAAQKLEGANLYEQYA